MKYEYVYRSSDGVRRVEEMEAPSREAVFESLRARGVRAVKVVAMDGSRANGEVRVVGVRKRAAFAAIAVTAVAVAGGMWLADAIAPSSDDAAAKAVYTVAASPGGPAGWRIAVPLPRQPIHGDRVRIENPPTNLFATAAEAFLSKFAEPGREVGDVAITNLVSDDALLMRILDTPIRTADDEFTEYVDLKRMTAWIKREMRTYLRGGHTQMEYVDALVKRQRYEAECREKGRRKIDERLADKSTARRDVYDLWLKVNARLQSMGIYAIPLPDELRDFQMALDDL